jgi:hypothetical protein
MRTSSVSPSMTRQQEAIDELIQACVADAMTKFLAKKMVSSLWIACIMSLVSRAQCVEDVCVECISIRWKVSRTVNRATL